MRRADPRARPQKSRAEEGAVGVDRDAVALIDQCDAAAGGRFGGDVPYHQPVGTSGKSSIGDQSDRVAEARADQGRRRGQHFTHARPAPRPLVADDDDVTRTDPAGENSLETPLLRIEHPCGTGDPGRFDSRDLRHRTLSRKVTPENGEVPLRVDRLTPWTDHFLSGRGLRGHLSQ